MDSKKNVNAARTRRNAAIKVAAAAANAVKNAERNLSEAEAAAKRAETEANLGKINWTTPSAVNRKAPKNVTGRWGPPPPRPNSKEDPWQNKVAHKRAETARRRGLRENAGEGEVWHAAQKAGITRRNNNTYKKNRANYKNQSWLKRQLAKAGLAEGAKKPTRRANNVKKSWARRYGFIE